jgi:hypothetical protein
MARREPLVLRLYFHPPLYELARLIGYAGLPLDEARQLVQPLRERHGRAAMKAAEAEIVRIDDQAQPPRVVLTEECKRVCRQLLGPPPGPPEQATGDAEAASVEGREQAGSETEEGARRASA